MQNFKSFVIIIMLMGAGWIGIHMSDKAEASSGSVIVTGVTAGKGVVCAQFRLSTGEQISLTGQAVSEHAAGVALRLHGNWSRISKCQQGRTLHVENIEEL